METKILVTKSFDIKKIRNDFPILSTKVNGKPLVYLDSAASSQKPAALIHSLQEYYSMHYANIHRGVHYLSQLGTEQYENTRSKVADWIGAEKENQIIFTKGTTDGINLIASGFRESILKEKDEIIISSLEHHSNIVPWQLALERTGGKLVVWQANKNGDLDLNDLKKLINPKTKLLSITHVSNAIGTVNPIKDIISLAHSLNVPVCVDGAQSIVHFRLNMQELNPDFFVFSAHKMYGPTGVGALYAKKEWLDRLPPYQGGGDMIDRVTFQQTTYNEIPHKFEAGTPNIAGVIGFGKTIQYLNQLDWEAVEAHEKNILQYALTKLQEFPEITLIGNPKNRSGLISFVVKDLHHYDIGTLLDQMGIAVRTGHHCAQPLMDFYAVSGTIRVSFGLYTTKEDIDALCVGLKKSIQMLG